MKTILLADDSITIQKVVELTFSDADYKVVCVSSGMQALKKLSEVRPDVILLDVIMPEKNGYEVCEQLKRSPATSGIPVLLLTGTFEPFDKKRADAAGANGHLTKPFESQALVAKVEELIASTPAIADDEQGGQMDIISGGEVYHVDPGRAAEGMRPAPPPAAPPQTPVSGIGSAGPAPAPVAAAAGRPFAPFAGEEKEAEARPHPALASPDPAAGGSYVGFADVGLDRGMEGSIVPDRFDEPAGGGIAASTTRLRRDAVLPSRDATPSGVSGTAKGASSAGSGDAFAGSFEAEFDLADEMASGAPTADAMAEPGEVPSWTPPPEAPPPETWQVSDEPAEPTPQPAATPQAAKPAAAEGKGLGLTPEMIDLIAEKVVQRLSDRVVREIAWEVVPGVAETLVRRRIKDLEEG